MKKISVYKAADGSIHEDKERCAAANLHYLLPKSQSDNNSKILSYSNCLEIVKYRSDIQRIFNELDMEVAKTPAALAPDGDRG